MAIVGIYATDPPFAATDQNPSASRDTIAGFVVDYTGSPPSSGDVTTAMTPKTAAENLANERAYLGIVQESIAIGTVAAGTLTTQKVTGNIASITRLSMNVFKLTFVTNYASASDYDISASSDSQTYSYGVTARNVGDCTITFALIGFGSPVDLGWVSMRVAA